MKLYNHNILIRIIFFGFCGRLKSLQAFYIGRNYGVADCAHHGLTGVLFVHFIKTFVLFFVADSTVFITSEGCIHIRVAMAAITLCLSKVLFMSGLSIAVLWGVAEITDLAALIVPHVSAKLCG